MVTRVKGLHFVHITESLAAGVLKSILQISKAQLQASHQVTILYLNRTNTPSESELHALMPEVNFRLVSNSSLKGLLTLFLKLIFENKFREKGTYVHAHSSWAGFIVRLVSTLRLIPNLYYTPHCFAFLRKDTSRFQQQSILLIEKILGKYSNGITLGCGSSEAMIAESIGSKKVRIACNYVDVPDTFRDKGLVKNPIIGNVGRISPQKNPNRFIEAKEHFPKDWDFTWVGDGDPTLKANLISANVQVSGWVSSNSSQELFANLDYLMLTSDWEGAPFSLLEAMAYGVIPIVWNFRGVEGIIKNGVNGFIVDSAEDFHAAIELLQMQPALKHTISQSAWEFVHANHNMRDIVTQWTGFYGL